VVRRGEGLFIACCTDVDPASLFFGMPYLTGSTIFPYGSSKGKHLYAYQTEHGSISLQSAVGSLVRG
jgi:hypothetical protein